MRRPRSPHLPVLAVSALATVVALSATLYWISGAITLRRIDADLASVLSLSLQAVTGAHGRSGDPLQSVERVVAAFRPRSTNLVVVDRQTQREFNARAYLPPDDPALVFLTVPRVDTLAKVLLDHRPMGQDYVTALSFRGAPVRIHMREILLGGRRMVVAQTRSATEVALVRRTALQWLVPGFVLACLFMLIPPHLVVRRSIRGVDQLAEDARRLARGSGTARLSPGGGSAPIEELVEAVNTLLARLEGDASDVRTLLAQASHELRTPVAVLGAEVQDALDRDQPTAGELRQSLRLIRQEVAGLHRLVDDLFLVARAGAGEAIARPAPTYLDDVVRESAMAIAKLGGTLPLVAIAEDDYSYVGDESMLRRAVTNLVENAMRHATEGRPIRVALRRTPHGYQVDVWNHGPPIAPEDRDRIFDRFYRGSRAPGAAGLGLQVVRLIATAHGGQVSLAGSSEVDGTTFRLDLPLQSSPLGP